MFDEEVEMFDLEIPELEEVTSPQAAENTEMVSGKLNSLTDSEGERAGRETWTMVQLGRM